MFWLPSARERLNVKFVNAPALLLESWVLWPSANGTGFGHPLVVNGDEPANGLASVHGVNRAFVVAVPHVMPLAMVERGPPLIFRSRSLKGSCGLCRKLTSRRPVAGFGTAWPSRRTATPMLLSASMKTRYGGPGV